MALGGIETLIQAGDDRTQSAWTNAVRVVLRPQVKVKAADARAAEAPAGAVPE